MSHMMILIFSVFFGFFSWCAEGPELAQSEAVSAELPVSPLLGFGEWKNQRVSQAQEALNEASPTQDPQFVGPPAPPEDPKIKAERVRQLEYNLEIAKSLSIHDYFALYLKDKNSDQISQLVEKLEPGQISQLLLAYKKSLFGEAASAGGR